MIRSMTAFDRREAGGPWGRLTWEVRAVNHRYLELHPRLPEALRALEPAVREHAASRLARGKVECTLRYTPSADTAGRIEIDWRRAGEVLDACRRLARRMGPLAAPGPVTDLLRHPGVLRESEPDLTPVHEGAMAAFREAMDHLVAYREREGARIAEHIQARAAQAAEHVAAIAARRVEVNAGVRRRLEARLADLPTPPDAGRLEQELVYIAQRLDVDEELDRLQSHLTEVLQSLESREPVGRRLDFLMQELNREANTIGSKASDAETTRHSVELKVLIEQMREQIQNVE